LLDLANKNRKRVKQGLDVRNLVQSQEDLIYLMKKILGKRQMWLFANQKRRYLSLNHDLAHDCNNMLRMHDKGYDLIGIDAI
jgi:hypothetical protein